jgi:type I restriction enzyme, S subunit
MTPKWKFGILDDAVTKGSSNVSLNKIKDEEGDYPVYGAKGFVQNVSFYQQEDEYLGIIKDGAGIGRVSKHPRKSSILATMQYILPKSGFEIQFIKYFLNYIDFERYRTGSTIPHIYYKDYKLEPFPLATLPEQKRIVAKLDQAFEAIDKAKANVERNLQNAKDLFQSKLNEIFSQAGEGWVEKKLGECIKLKSGDGLTAKNMNQEGLYPVYGGNGIAGNHDTYNSEGMQVIIGRVGALCGNVRYLNEKLWLTDNAFKVSKFYYAFDEAFLTYLLNYKNLRSYARQAAQPVISNSSTSDVPLEFPLDVEQQKSIVSQLDELKTRTQSFDGLYNQKLDALSELKKSILQKAFNGEL